MTDPFVWCDVTASISYSSAYHRLKETQKRPRARYAPWPWHRGGDPFRRQYAT